MFQETKYIIILLRQVELSDRNMPYRQMTSLDKGMATQVANNG